MKGALALLTVLAGCSQATAQSEDLFGSVCARCHGALGLGGVAKAGIPAPRNFHDAAFQSARSDAQIRATIVEGKGGAMPSFRGAFSAAQLDALVARVRSFAPGR